jgi:hypothetical protein
MFLVGAQPGFNAGIDPDELAGDIDDRKDQDVVKYVSDNINKLFYMSSPSSFYVDADQVDQGSVNGTSQTLRHIIKNLDLKQYATVIFRHNSNNGNFTKYIFNTSIDLRDYPNLYFYFEPGAQLIQATGDEILIIYSPENILSSSRLQITEADMINFAVSGKINAAWWGFKPSANGGLNANAIQYAINSRPSRGATIYLHGGNYMVAPDVVDLSSCTNVSLTGAATGRSYASNLRPATILNFTKGAIGINAYTDVHPNKCNYNKITNLYIYGNSVLKHGIKISGTANTIEDTTVKGCTETGIWAKQAVNSLVLSRVSCEGNMGGTGYGFKISYGSVGNTILKVSSSNFRCNVIGVQIENITSAIFDNCVIESNTGTGLNLYKIAENQDVHEITFNNIWFENNGTVLTDYAVVIDSIKKNYNTWISKNIEFNNCHFHSSGKRYMNLQAVNYCKINDCYFAGGDNANGIQFNPDYAYAIEINNRKGPSNWKLSDGNAGALVIDKAITQGGTVPGWHSSGMMRSATGPTQTLWFGIDNIFDGTTDQVCKTTTYNIGGTSIMPEAYPILRAGSIIGCVVWRSYPILTGTITIQPWHISPSAGFGGKKIDYRQEGGGSIAFTMDSGDGTFLSHNYIVHELKNGSLQGGININAGEKIGIHIDADTSYTHINNSHTLIGLIIEY